MAINSQTLSKEQVLIVGCGDIGRRLAQCLPAERYAVTGLRRQPSADLPYLHYQACDVTAEGELAQVLRQQDYGVIVVTMTPGERSDAGYERAYVQVCRQLVDGLRTQGCRPRLLVFVSSTAVYSQMDGSWVDELSPTVPEGFSGKRLLEAEQVIQHSGFNNTIVRFSGIYGPNRNRLIAQVRRGEASGSGHYTNRIHADDGARSLAFMIERQGMPLAPVYLVSDSAPAPMLEVVTWLAGQLGVDKFLSEAAANERGNKRCSNRLLLEAGFNLQYPDYKAGYSAILAQI